MEKQEYRTLIKHCFLMGKTSEQSLKWLQKCYSTSAPSRTTVYRWFSEFKMGRTRPILPKTHLALEGEKRLRMRKS